MGGSDSCPAPSCTRTGSLISDHALPDIQSPPTPCAPIPATLLAQGRLRLRFALPAIGGSSDFAHCSQSRQSHQAVSSSYRGSFQTRQFYRLSVHFQLLSTHLAVTQLLSVDGGKLRHRGTFTLLCTLSLKRTSAGVPPAGFGVLAETIPQRRPVRSARRPPMRPGRSRSPSLVL